MATVMNPSTSQTTVLTPVGLSPDAQPLSRYGSVLDPRAYAGLRNAGRDVREALRGRAVWNINSTAEGGGVAEMLAHLIRYARGAGVDARWMVVGGDAEFFRVTKRIHNKLHGAAGDGGGLGRAERRAYEAALHPNATELSHMVGRDDVVMLHDPQTAGLIPALKKRCGQVIWRCHVGVDSPNELVREAWDFLLPFVSQADAVVFSRREFAWEGLNGTRVVVVPPAIDAFSPKNQDMALATARSILHRCGMLSYNGFGSQPWFTREDGSADVVRRRAGVTTDGLPSSEVPLVVQVSRWDDLKDPLGVIRGFGSYVVSEVDAHLILAGPEVKAVADDPEGPEVLRAAHEARDRLPPAVRARVHLACLPMEDAQENAAIVNALQRHATVVVQKSLAEGFGLTVSEAMWKSRPVVATRIGGIQDQIDTGVSGVLIDDPSDLAAYGEAVVDLLDNPSEALRMGEAASRRVRDAFLCPRQLMQYGELIASLGQRPGPR